MSNHKSSVLKALRILGPEEILKLSETHQERNVLNKKAVGGEFIVWDEQITPRPPGRKSNPKKSQTESVAQIIPFPQGSYSQAQTQNDKQDESRDLLSSEDLLKERNSAKISEENAKKNEAFKKYANSNKTLAVKSLDIDGKTDVREVSTQGVLINKKVA